MPDMNMAEDVEVHHLEKPEAPHFSAFRALHVLAHNTHHLYVTMNVSGSLLPSRLLAVSVAVTAAVYSLETA